MPFLIRLLEHPDVRAGHIHTRFVEEHVQELLTADDPPLEALAAAAVATPEVAFGPPAGASRGVDPWQTIRGWGR